MTLTNNKAVAYYWTEMLNKKGGIEETSESEKKTSLSLILLCNV